MVKVAIHQPDEIEAPPLPVAEVVAGNSRPTAPADNPPARSRRRYGLLKFLVLTILLAVAAPSLITVTGTAGLLLGLVAPKYAAAIQFEAVQLHWWSPAAISRLQLRDLSEISKSAGSMEAGETIGRGRFWQKSCVQRRNSRFGNYC
jgi:hypothetical protein